MGFAIPTHLSTYLVMPLASGEDCDFIRKRRILQEGVDGLVYITINFLLTLVII